MITGIHSFFKNTRRRGMALIITLIALVLMTVLVLAFFTRAQINRRVSFSSTSMLKANILGRSALEIVVGEIRDEITSGSSSYGGSASYPKVYIPTSGTDSLPRQLGVSSATGPLVKVSGNNIPIRPSGTIQGSSVSIDTRSGNNRLISTSRWFTSTTSSPQLGSQSTLPTWLFITRGNDIKTPASFDTAKDPSSSDYVIGRFAYTVYDIGGLLDVNVAGYPAVASSDVGYKSSLAYTDLSLVGVPSSSAFVSWRNATTGTSAASFKEWATGISGSSGTLSAAALAAARSGHTEAVAGDNAVLSRHDLLNNSLLSGSAAKLLTHFSRSINAPSAIPAAVTTNNPNLADVRITTPGTLTHYLDDGTTTTYSVEAGDPLLQRRFSLAKLAWIGHGGPNASAFASSLSASDRQKAIEVCFGMDWDSTNNRWIYNDGAIKSLGDVASLNREPNFFEMLKAGIVEGSIGKASSIDSSGVPYTAVCLDQMARESIKDLQILKIGINIIDCAKSDNYPSTVFCNYSGIPVATHGTADLPYLSYILNAVLFSKTTGDTYHETMRSCSVVVLPELFNPNRISAATTAGPSKIRIRVANGTLNYLYVSSEGLSGKMYRTPNSDLTALSSIVIPSSSFDAYRSGVKLVYDTEATSSTTLVSLLGSSVITGTSGSFHGFNVYTYTTGLPASYLAQTGTLLRASISNLVFALEYWDDAASRWQVYDTLVGNEESSSNTGITSPPQNSSKLGQYTFFPNVDKTYLTINEIGHSVGTLGKFDPRSSRFGVSGGGALPSDNETLRHLGFGSNVPFGTSNSLAAGVYPGLWVQGAKKDWIDSDGSAISNVADPDGTPRPGDGWLDQSATAKNGASSKTNLFANVSDTTNACRPIILHRPFRNVAELGYVFRDSPWKSLSFFDETSGDSALLDLFSVADEPAVTAGKVALNTTQTAIQKALLTGAAQSVDGTNALANPSAIASGYNSYAFSSGVPTASMSLNIAGITSFMSSGNLNSAYSTSATPIKSERESVVRALAGSTQTRTWNLLIDVVAQVGRYPITTNNLNDFIVEGESRYWLSIAIDRYTGKVISQQLEPVNE
jgi:hypothetical protein